MSTIPLLRLPLLVLEEVLKCLNPIELFKLSECSKKIINLIPLAGTRNYELFANFSKDIIIINDCYYFGNLKFCSWIRERYRMKIDGNLISCLRRMLDLFKCGIHRLETRRETEAAEFKLLIPIILKNDRLIKKFTLKGTSISAGNLKQIFEISESLKSDGITRSDLLALKQCVSINLRNSQLTNEDLDIFLEFWKNGEFPNLECAFLHDGNFCVKQKLAGLGGWPRNINDGYKQKRINNCTVFMHGGETIERVDGVKAMIQLHTSHTFIFFSDKTEKLSIQNFN